MSPKLRGSYRLPNGSILWFEVFVEEEQVHLWGDGKTPSGSTLPTVYTFDDARKAYAQYPAVWQPLIDVINRGSFPLTVNTN